MQDDTKKHSLAATYILDTWTRNIVASYISRPYKADMYHEQLWRGLEYYNAIDNYEANLKGLFTYFSTKKKTHLLSPELFSLKNKLNLKPSKNPIRGTKSDEKINSLARELIHTWSTEMVRIGQDEETGEDIETPRMNLIPSIGLLEEIIQWSNKGNYDRVSALGMLMLLLFDRDYELESHKVEVNDMFDKGIFSRMKKKLNNINKNEDFRFR